MGILEKKVKSEFEARGLRVGGPGSDLVVTDDRFWRIVALQNSLGLGRAYMNRWFECEDIRTILATMARHRRDQWIEHPPHFRSFIPSSLPEWGIKLRMLNPFSNPQSAKKSSTDIQSHYDKSGEGPASDPDHERSNTFYSLMLDPTGEYGLTYSCAYFMRTTSLGQAQNFKNHHVATKLDLSPGKDVLDIGCGWGATGAWIAEHNPGVRVHGVTNSPAQYMFAVRKYARLIRERRLFFYLMDYRDIPSKFEGRQFDAIYSIGMFEHLGWGNYLRFFKINQRFVKLDRPIMIHTIVGNGGVEPFIGTEIFPGGILPTEAMVIRAAARQRLVLEGCENLGPFYSQTLAAWRKNLLAARPEILKLGYTESEILKYEFYLVLCDVGFYYRLIQLDQFTFARGGIKGGWTWGLRDYSKLPLN